MNVLVLRRPLPDQRSRAYRRAARRSWEARVTLDLQRLDPGIAGLVERVEDPDARAYLEGEVEQWVRCFASLVERQHVQAQLTVVGTDMCRKFHTDWVPLRLLCTLAGPATEWLDDQDVVRTNLARFDLGLEEANHAVLQPGSTPQRAAPGDVVLLKGDAWPGNEGRGAVHRSPPIETAGERRLLLKLDTPSCGC